MNPRVAVFCGLFLTAPAFALGALDGKTFQGVTADAAQGADKAQRDEFSFVGGKFNSVFFSRLGYGAGSYTAMADDKNIRFEAQAVHRNGAKLKWSGIVRGQDIEGSVTVIDKDRGGRSWFKGRLK